MRPNLFSSISRRKGNPICCWAPGSWRYVWTIACISATGETPFPHVWTGTVCSQAEHIWVYSNLETFLLCTKTQSFYHTIHIVDHCGLLLCEQVKDDLCILIAKSKTSYPSCWKSTNLVSSLEKQTLIYICFSMLIFQILGIIIVSAL
jgi:hypothetical protein